ncbi:MAG: hypothetical protein ACRCSP_03015, partial [Rhodoglobus sp.]
MSQEIGDCSVSGLRRQLVCQDFGDGPRVFGRRPRGLLLLTYCGAGGWPGVFEDDGADSVGECDGVGFV